LSFRSARAKAKAWNPFPGALVSPGHWLAEAARQSVVFRDCTVRVIPNGLDGTLFRPEGRREARQRLGIAQDAKVILTGAMGAVTDNRKGFSLLADALQRCRQTARADNWHLLVFGADSGPSQSELGLPVIYGGKVAVEEQLPRYYQAGDVYALPSLQDNLPNTVVESLACGTPVVGFRSSGPASMIVDGKTGKLAEPFSSASLAEALQDVLSRDQSNWQAACRREFEDRYAHPGPAIQYVNLYEELLGGSSRPSEISASHSLIQ
jgi:glycosyltransferase involved in cell wall biosynthesis